MKIDGKKISNQLIRDPEGDSIGQDENGIYRATAVFRCDWKRVFSLMPKRYVSKHPDFNNLLCERVQVEKERGNVARITAEYSGGDATSGNFGVGTNNPNAPIVEVSSTASQEPIETHPEFETLAGTPENPLWPGVFDDEGRFAGFPRTDADGNECPYFGVTSYLAPRIVVRQISLSKSQPTNVRVGFRDDSPYGQGDFLKTAHNFRRDGDIYVIEEEWLGPADGGQWDTTIYDS